MADIINIARRILVSPEGSRDWPKTPERHTLIAQVGLLKTLTGAKRLQDLLCKKLRNLLLAHEFASRIVMKEQAAYIFIF
jgi:hypothetical protein